MLIIKLKGDIEVLKRENRTRNKEIAELKEKNKWFFRTTEVKKKWESNENIQEYIESKQFMRLTTLEWEWRNPTRQGWN